MGIRSRVKSPYNLEGDPHTNFKNANHIQSYSGYDLHHILPKFMDGNHDASNLQIVARADYQVINNHCNAIDDHCVCVKYDVK